MIDKCFCGGKMVVNGFGIECEECGSNEADVLRCKHIELESALRLARRLAKKYNIKLEPNMQDCLVVLNIMDDRLSQL